MSPSANAGTSKNPAKMAAAKNVPSDSKSVTAKMHRRSRSGTSLCGVHDSVKLTLLMHFRLFYVQTSKKEVRRR